MKVGDLELVEVVLRAAVFPVVSCYGAAVVDGGTDSGVMRALGQAHAHADSRFPLIGVAVERMVDIPGQPEPAVAESAVIEPHHTHIVLVPGISWGDESPWLHDVASVIADASAR
ncbi:MAG: hypothetical protein M3Z25_04460 [Actinomycetota bacterium]|nr:hypothetical protein [Actinomycetota bacterium]